MSPTILCIESSAGVCAGYLSDGTRVFERYMQEGFVHSEKLAGFVHEVIQEAKQEGCQPEAVAVNAGPGSYTGLRIGAALAKGLCMGFDVPLIALDALALLDWIARQKSPQYEHYVSAIDASNNRVYLLGRSAQGQSIIEPKLIDLQKDEVPVELLSEGTLVFGDGAAVVRALEGIKAQCEVVDIHPEWLYQMAVMQYEKGEFTSLHAFKPNYLKKFVTTTPKTLDRILKGK